MPVKSCLTAAAVVLLGTMPAVVSATPVQQLRIYKVPSANEAVFHARFRDQAMPIMRRYGFKIVATWRAPSEDGVEFVYLLDWPDEATMKQAWDGFLADEQWQKIKRQTASQHGVFVERIEDRVLHPTEYSPARN